MVISHKELTALLEDAKKLGASEALQSLNLKPVSTRVKPKKVNHRTKEYIDNLKREILLDHNAKIKKANNKKSP